MPQLQEFEELIGEKIKPEIFHTQAESNLEIEPEPELQQDWNLETPAVEEDEFFEAPFEETDNKRVPV